jgi:phospholipase/carboxylesterase
MANSTEGLSRRDFLGVLAALAVAPAASSWRVLAAGPRLTARPGKPTQPWKVGLTPLWDDRPGAFLYIPRSYDPAKPTPFVVSLHGATQRANFSLRVWTPQADAAGFVLLAPESEGITWDAIRGEYGDDVSRIDRALKLAFAQVNVDPTRVVLEGFSDGASYGIGLGLNNRDLFTRIVANSPGLITPYDRKAPGPRPRIFISHGHQDQILPYEYAGPRVAEQLRRDGYAVQFRDFQGKHEIPTEVAAEAVKFMMS